MKLNVRSSSFGTFSKCGAFDPESGGCNQFSLIVHILSFNKANYKAAPERIRSNHRRLVPSLENIARKEKCLD